MDEVKGIFIRNGLKPNDFDNIKGGKKLADDIQKHKYKKDKDWKIAEDLFEPMSLPHQEYIKIPTDVNYEFIDTEELINKLQVLYG